MSKVLSIWSRKSMKVVLAMSRVVRHNDRTMSRITLAGRRARPILAAIDRTIVLQTFGVHREEVEAIAGVVVVKEVDENDANTVWSINDPVAAAHCLFSCLLMILRVWRILSSVRIEHRCIIASDDDNATWRHGNINHRFRHSGQVSGVRRRRRRCIKSIPIVAEREQQLVSGGVEKWSPAVRHTLRFTPTGCKHTRFIQNDT